MSIHERRPRVGLIVAVLAALGLSGFATVSAAADADVHAGIYSEPDAVAFGAGFLTPVGDGTRWYFNPTADVAFGDDDLVALNGDFHYDFASDASLTFWAGAGPSIIWRDTGGGTDANMAVNLLAGLGSARGSTRPFAQVKAILADEGGVAFTGGVRF